MTVRYNTNIVTDGLRSFWDPGNLKSSPAQNLLLQSEALATTPWGSITGSGGAITLTDNSAVAPDGSNTATTVNVTTFASGISFFQDVLASGNGTYKFSIYFKPGTQTSTTTFAMFFTGGTSQGFNAVFNATTGALNSQTGFDASSTPVGNGWFRWQFKATGTIPSNTNIRFQIYPNSTGTAFFWGAQLSDIDAPDTYVKSITTQVGSSATLFDLGPSGNNISINGRPTHSSDGVGSLFFGGVTTQNGTLTTTTGLPSGDLTMMAWVKPTSTQPLANIYTGILGYGNRTSTNIPSTAVALSLDTTTPAFWVTHAFYGNDYRPNNNAVSAVPDQWNLIGLVARSTPLANNVTLFSFNSAGYNSITGNSSQFTRGTVITNQNISLGSLEPGGSRYIRGNISMAMIYGRPLSQSEILQNVQATRGRYGL